MDGKAGENLMETSLSYSDDDDSPQLPTHMSRPNETASVPFTIVQNGNVVTPIDKDETSSKETNNTPLFSSSVGSFNRNLGFYQSENHTSPVTTTASAFEKNENNKILQQLSIKNETSGKIPSSNNVDNFNPNLSNPIKGEKNLDVFTFILLLVLVGGVYYFIVEMNWKPLNSQITKLEQEIQFQSDIIRQLATRSEKYKMESQEQKSLMASLELELKFTSDELATMKMELLKQGGLIENIIKERKIPIDSYSKSSTKNNQDERQSYSGGSLSSVSHFRQSVKSLMKSSFLSQTRDTWIQIVAAVLPTMSEEEKPIRPAALLILSPSWIEPDFGVCFARKLGESINEAFHAMNKFGDESNKVKEMNSNYFNEKASLTDVHNDLKNYLNFEGKSVIVKNLNEIQKEDDLLVFHAFCDNSNGMAYDTRANFIFTLNVPHSIQEDYDWTHWNGAQIARQTLNKVWANSMSADKRAALISRVAAHVILLQDGDSCS